MAVLSAASVAGANCYNATGDCVILIRMSVHEHEKHARKNLKLGVITASDSRTLRPTRAASYRRVLEEAGHLVDYYEILPDDARKFRGAGQ